MLVYLGYRAFLLNKSPSVFVISGLLWEFPEGVS